MAGVIVGKATHYQVWACHLPNLLLLDEKTPECYEHGHI